MNAIILYGPSFKTLSLFRLGLIFPSCGRDGGLRGHPVYNFKTPRDILANKSCKDHFDSGGGGGGILPYGSQIGMRRRSCPFRLSSLPFLRLRANGRDATLLTNNSQHCWMLHLLRPSVHSVACCWMLLRVVAQSLKPVKLCRQQLPTLLAQRCWELLRPFQRSLRHLENF